MSPVLVLGAIIVAVLVGRALIEVFLSGEGPLHR
jgi:hypothetical protein